MTNSAIILEESGDTDGEQENGGRCFLKKAFFFKSSQVEKITA